jgi:hypothetical protein
MSDKIQSTRNGTVRVGPETKTNQPTSKRLRTPALGSNVLGDDPLGSPNFGRIPNLDHIDLGSWAKTLAVRNKDALRLLK